MSWYSEYKIQLGVITLSIIIAILVLVSDNELQATKIIDSDVFHSSYSNNKTLYGVNSTKNLKQKFSDKVYGGIVSHHLLSNIDIAKFFYEFSDQDVDRVILIGPNHFYPTTFPALSTNLNYKTPFGEVVVDSVYLEKLISQKLVQVDNTTVDTEHSISSLVPYIAKYLPEAKLVPIILIRNAPDKLLGSLSEFLKENNTENTVVIASVDFSHHLFSNTSRLHDLRSISAIKSFDIKSLSELEVDSPQSLNVLLRYLMSIDVQDISLWQQNAAVIFDEHDIEDVTSYVFAHARKGDIRPEESVSVMFFGDTMLGRGVEEVISDGTDLFAGIRGPEGNFLRGYDAIAVNLEGAIASDSCTLNEDGLLIQPENLNVLTKEKISHAGIANNHFGRCNEETALSKVAEVNLKSFSSNEVSTIQGTGMDVGVISVYAAPVPNDFSEIVEKVKTASKDYDNLIVNVHWGVEYNTEPTSLQKELAHAMVDVGANIIIGHHPHVVQPVEVYNGSIIAYSLGNFISDQGGELTKSGIAAGVFLEKESSKLFIFPFEQIDGIPVHLTQEDSRKVCENLYNTNIQDYISDQHPCVIEVSND